jgi:hypothetical protein
MKKNFVLLVFLFVGYFSLAQKQGIGLRLGDPVGITYKKYLPRNHAFELGIGGASPQWHRTYYQNSFDEYSKYDNYRYVGHTVESTVYLQARYLFHYDIPVEGMQGKLDWYWGAGAMLKLAKIKYRYKDAENGPATFTDIKTDIDIGPEGILGMEYFFDDIPLSVFGEASLLVELADRPGAVRVFGGVGLRYIFKPR